jgi:hypothetical protein
MGYPVVHTGLTPVARTGNSGLRMGIGCIDHIVVDYMDKAAARNTDCIAAASIVAPVPLKLSFRHPSVESSCGFKIVWRLCYPRPNRIIIYLVDFHNEK